MFILQHQTMDKPKVFLRHVACVHLGFSCMQARNTFTSISYQFFLYLEYGKVI